MPAGATAESAITIAIADYLRWLEIDRHASPYSVTAARHDLRVFAEDCAAANLHEPATIDVHFIRAHIARLHRAGREPRSVARMLSSIRCWLRHEVELRHLAANPAQGVRAPKGRHELPKAVEAETLNTALDRGARDAGGDAWKLRDQAILELLYSSGLRLSELQALDAPHGPMPDELRVLGKGRKERIVPVGAKARAALDLWLAARITLAHVGETALFISNRGTRLTHRAIEQRVDHWARSVGLPGHLHPHRLRHSFATDLLTDSGQLRPVQELLGHANLSTTQIYTALDWKRLAEAYDQAHPRAHRKSDNDKAS
ncbi:MAG: tyrosine recombinase XerC [Nevskiaceae bacterium]|nr:MAG: tyrosine recombinase XerC [Nevskiaceae bacterium]TBR73089.1 MAG: tyrosine recombinase XerC [Nevskiaceae bacterium]